jgi:hypothetical protein
MIWDCDKCQKTEVSKIMAVNLTVQYTEFRRRKQYKIHLAFDF